jgi:hypothetical protein
VHLATVAQPGLEAEASGHVDGHKDRVQRQVNLASKKNEKIKKESKK